MLSHPNVVTAYSASQIGELLVFAMEYIDGEDLAKLVKTGGPLPMPHACYYAQQAALGLHHAYEKKMVHRDIKPQNLILYRDGRRQVIKVLDFGLAKVLREKKEDHGLTAEGQVLGTPDYVAPEQISDAASADIRADIYSLGCTLYYLLSGAPPFKGKSLFDVLQAHHLMEARLLNLVRPDVPEELAAVVRKMMAKEASKRYQTPIEVAQALTPFVKQTAKGVAAKASHSLSLPSKTETKDTKRAQPMLSKEPAERQKPEAPLDELMIPIARDTVTEGVTMSSRPRNSGRTRRRKFAAKQRGMKTTWSIVGGLAAGVLLIGLIGIWAGGVFKVKTKEGILVLEVNEPNPDVYVDGDRVTIQWANGGQKAEIRVNPGKRKLEVKKEGFTAFGEEVTLDEGGRQIVNARLEPEAKSSAATAPQTARDSSEKLDLSQIGVEIRTLRGLPSYLHAIAIPPDGSCVIACYGAANQGCLIFMWDLQTGRLLGQFKGHQNAVKALAFAPNGKTVLSGGEDNTVRLWDTAAKSELHCFRGHTGPVVSVNFSHDGLWALSSSHDGTMRLWDLTGKREVKAIRSGAGPVNFAIFLPGDERALSNSIDCTTRVWDISSSNELYRFQRQTVIAAQVVLLPDGKRVISGGYDGVIRLWDVEKGITLQQYSGHSGTVTALAISPDSKYIASGGTDKTIKVWDLKTGQELKRWVAHSEMVTSIQFSPDGRLIISGGWDSNLKIWKSGKQ